MYPATDIVNRQIQARGTTWPTSDFHAKDFIQMAMLFKVAQSSSVLRSFHNTRQKKTQRKTETENGRKNQKKKFKKERRKEERQKTLRA